MKKLSFEEGIKEIITFCSNKQFIIGIAGGSGSGKTYLTRILKDKLNAKVISTDDYYIGIDKMSDENFDSPSAVDIELLRKHLLMLRKCKVEKPIYNFKDHKRKGYEEFYSKRIIVEGIFALMLKDVLDFTVFIDCDEKIRLERRIKRDIKERGRTKECILEQWNNSVEPMYKEFVIKQMDVADILIKT